MITIDNIRNVKLDEYDHVFAIVRSMKSQSPGITQVADLSPSYDLFTKYRTLVKNNNWNASTFASIYVPQFLQEMKQPAATQWLNKLYNLDKQGSKICLICFCPEEVMCHRSIVAGLLQGVGVNVTTNSNTDYSHYYKQYQQI